MVPQPQIHFAKLNLKNLRGPMSILNIPKRDTILCRTAILSCPRKRCWNHGGQPGVAVLPRPGYLDVRAREKLSGA